MNETSERCPLCGGPNGCAVAKSSNDDAPCWCRDAIISEAAISRVPFELLGKACICVHCASKYEKSPAVNRPVVNR
jgi:hypothetical protein